MLVAGFSSAALHWDLACHRDGVYQHWARCLELRGYGITTETKRRDDVSIEPHVGVSQE